MKLKHKAVVFKAIVKSAYEQPGPEWKLYSGDENSVCRSIWRLEVEGEGICLGISKLQEGFRDPGGTEYGDYGSVLGHYGPSFSQVKSHKVYAVSVEAGTELYLKHEYVLPKDIQRAPLFPIETYELLTIDEIS